MTAFYSHATRSIFSENLRGSKYSLLPLELAGLRAPRPKEAKSNAFQAAVSHSRQYPLLLAAPSRVGSGVYVARWADYVPRRADKPARAKKKKRMDRADETAEPCRQ